MESDKMEIGSMRSRFVRSGSTKSYEGVGRALVSVYSAHDAPDVPDDMARLLDMLDERTNHASG